MTKYREHDRIVREICVEFEAEHVSDTEDVKKLRFERIVDLMQQVKRSYLSLFCVSRLCLLYGSMCIYYLLIYFVLDAKYGAAT